MKLNLGCGNNKKGGYINIDTDPQYSPDILSDIQDLTYDNESIDEIIASHVIEHIPMLKVITCLKNWYGWLKHGGALYLAIPDWDVMHKLFLNRCDFNTWSDVFFGGEEKSMAHQWMINGEGLRELVYSIGFNIEGNFGGLGGSSDFEISGTPISLNLYCVKK